MADWAEPRDIRSYLYHILQILFNYLVCGYSYLLFPLHRVFTDMYQEKDYTPTYTHIKCEVEYYVWDKIPIFKQK